MNILLIGSGAREHAIAAAINRSPQQTQLFCCGISLNPGIKQLAQAYWIGDINDVDTISQLAHDWQIGLAIIGPEAPLEKGLADALWRHAIPCIGPKKKLAQIETSKAFARDLMHKYQIPGLPRYQKFYDDIGVADFLQDLGEHNYVIKANGLMGGKGVKVGGEHLASMEDALTYVREILSAGQSVIIEEKLIGQEFSFMCFCDGEHLIPMPIVQDHKRAYVDDKGPNTGGMGSYSDANHSLPFLKHEDVETAFKINSAVIHALQQEINDKYIGVLYGSFMVTASGVYVIEFNARFGDPEALNVLSILDSDFVKICTAMITTDLNSEIVMFAALATVCKYAVPEGYPDAPVKDALIDISAVKNKKQLYFSAVNASNGEIYATGSRTAAYVGVANTISAAEEIAEKEISAMRGPLFHRCDIGTDQLIQKRVDAMRHLRAKN